MATNYTIGISSSDTSVEWTTLHATQDGLEIRESRKENLDESGALPALFHDHHKDTIVSGLPASTLLTHVFNLPSTDPDEIAGMVELQLDKISPYPLQQLVVSYEILAQGETYTRVLVAGVRREIIDQLGAQLKSAGLVLNSLDLELLCRWDQLLRADKIEAEGGEAILVFEKGEAGLIIAENGEPLLFRALPVTNDTPANELFAELEYSMTMLEQEFHMQELHRIDLWSDGSLPEMAQAIKQQDDQTANCFDLAELPPLSNALARRYQRREMHHLELVPKEWIEAATNKALMRKLYKFSGIVLGIWLALVLMASIAISVHKHQVTELRNIAEQLNGPAKAVQESSRKMNALLSYTDQRYSAIESLREVSTLLPPGIDLSAFNYKKGRALTLRGEAESDDAVYKFFDTLAQSDFFKEIKDQRVTTATRKGRRISQFSLTATPEGIE
ncbi:PilN domain-containing protein [Verrucomicrobiota bacterium]